MEARAKARYVRVTPRKARRVVDMIRGMPAEEAQAVLPFAPQAASDPVYKVFASVAANAEQTHNLRRDDLFISAAFVDEGVTMRRIRPRAKGSASRILKRSSHITVVVERHPPGVAERHRYRAGRVDIGRDRAGWRRTPGAERRSGRGGARWSGLLRIRDGAGSLRRPGSR